MKPLLPLLFTATQLLASSLDSYLWKNRILILHLSEGKVTQFNPSLLEKNQPALIDRDLILLDLSPNPIKSKLTIRPPSKDLLFLRKKYRLTPTSPPTFILIGKDGTKKAIQSPQLDLAKVFSLIDTMPMRRREMRAQ
ncbi:MAG: DUF4174 domain-containing protein [Verrucomicrobiota bacterium]